MPELGCAHHTPVSLLAMLRVSCGGALLPAFARCGGVRFFAKAKLDPTMFPEHKRFWDLAPHDLQVRACRTNVQTRRPALALFSIFV